MSRKRGSRQKKKNSATAKRVITKPVRPVDTASKRLCCVGAAFLKFCIRNLLFESFPTYDEGQLTKKSEEELPKLQEKLTIYSRGNRSRTHAFVGSFLVLNGVKLTSMFMKNFVVIEAEEETVAAAPCSSFSPLIYPHYCERQFQRLEEKIGYTFQDRALLLQAFTNGSHQLAKINRTYQRLEFLGDAILDYLIVRYLYNHSSKLTRPQITKYRDKLTSNSNFASLTMKHGFENYILKYNNKTQICGQKCYADIFESLAAAIFIDSGMNLDIVWRIFYKLMNEMECFNDLESNVQICVTQ